MVDIIKYKSPTVEELTYTGKIELEGSIDMKEYKVLPCRPGACECIGRCY